MKLLLGVVAASVFGLAACASTPSTPPATVATLATSGVPVATSGADRDAGRPRQRLDMTDDELNALDAAYDQCLAANGWSKKKSDSDPVAAATAEANCLSKNPLPPWEIDASNPHASDFVHAVVQCLRAKGVKYVDEGPPQGGRYVFSFGGTNNDSDSISKGLKFTPECEKEVAARGIGS